MAKFRNVDKRRRWETPKQKGERKRWENEMAGELKRAGLLKRTPREQAEHDRIMRGLDRLPGSPFDPPGFQTERNIKLRRQEPTLRQEVRDMEKEGVPRWVIAVFLIGYSPILLWRKLIGREEDEQQKAIRELQESLRRLEPMLPDYVLRPKRIERKEVRPTLRELASRDFSRLWRGFLNLIKMGRMGRFRRDEISEWRPYGT